MVERNRKKGRSLKRACLPMASVLVIRPERRFRHVPLQGQLHSTRPDAPEEQLVSPEDRLAYVRRRRLRLLGMSGVVEGFGCRPIAAMRFAAWPASESLQ